jgi:hypothetical protein
VLRNDFISKRVNFEDFYHIHVFLKENTFLGWARRHSITFLPYFLLLKLLA